MTEDDDAPIAWVRLLRAHAILVSRLADRLQEAHGLQFGEYEILIALLDAAEGRMRRVDLARRLLITQSGVTRRLHGLERAGLVAKARSEQDGRVSYAALTDAGARLARRARRTHRADVADLWTAHFTERQLEQLAALLGRVPGVAAPAWAPLPPAG